MNNLVDYLLPAFIFLIFSSLGIIVVLIWLKFFSYKQKSLSNRLNEVAELRRNAPVSSLKSQVGEQSAFMVWADSKLFALSKLQLLLIRSGSQQSGAQFVLLSAAVSLGGALLVSLITRQSLFVLALISFVALAIPYLYLLRKASVRRMKFEEQLPDALEYITRSLRAGHGLAISIHMASEELPQPVGGEFKITYDEINFGVSFSEAMSNLMVRVNSSDLSFFTIAVVIQRETGGNLTELLVGLAKTIRERIKLSGKVRVLAAEGKFSCCLLGGLPIVLGLIMNWLNPKYMGLLWYTESGHTLLKISAVMLILGAGLMYKMTQIKV